MTKTTFRIGARDSELSILQAQTALARMTEVSGCTFELIPFSSPGDRDQTTDLRFSAGDFFTRDLDEALLKGEIDAAIHSAKDLPPEGCREGIDWFWLPWREDPRDCLVSRCEHPKRIGVSSERRIAWVKKHLPEADCIPLRGTIPARIAKLDAGEYDAILVAAAALHRLKMSERITHYISLEDLPPPPGQGVLAVTFRRADEELQSLRNLWMKAVRFIGAGVGAAELCTLAGQRELQQAEVVIYDALMDATLLEEAPQAEKIYVGKRSGAHSMSQAEITALIETHVRRGQRVVRLKGGDPGLFGRLAEETTPLAKDGLPFRVWPGVSALTAATTPTGLLLTLRGESCGFSVETPRSTGHEKNAVYFMALGLAETLAQRYAPETPCAIVYDAGAPQQEVLRMTIATLKNQPSERPGLLIVGPAATRAFPFAGPLAGKKIWITGSPSVAVKAYTAITDLGGRPIVSPLVRFTPTQRIKIRPSKGYNLLVCTSPTAAKFFFSEMVSPIVYMPKKVAVTGPGTATCFEPYHIDCVCPEKDFSAKGLLATLPEDLKGVKILRVRSEEAGPALAEALRERGAKVKDLPFYKTESIEHPVIPTHDVVFLASSSAAKAWLASDAPKTIPTVAMGEPTAKALRAGGIEPTFVAKVSDVASLFQAYAAEVTRG